MEIAPIYTMKRQLDDYYGKYYNDLIERTHWICDNRYQKAFDINAWKRKIESNWESIEVETIKVPDPNLRPLTYGDMFIAEIKLKTPGLAAGDVGIELLFGDKQNDKILTILRNEEMKLVDSGEGWATYYISIPIYQAGVFNYTFRIFPVNDMLPHRQDMPLVKWI